MQGHECYVTFSSRAKKKAWTKLIIQDNKSNSHVKIQVQLEYNVIFTLKVFCKGA